MTEVELGDEDHVELNVGDEVVIRLRENGTTGYVWSVRELGDGLALVSDEFVPPGPQRGAGAAGERLVRIRAVARRPAPGSADVVLEHGRAWEPEPIERRRVRVVVTG